MKPFSDTTGSMGIGGMTFENTAEGLAVYGTHTITRSPNGLNEARRLVRLFQDCVDVLAAGEAACFDPVSTCGTVQNPFSNEVD